MHGEHLTLSVQLRQLPGPSPYARGTRPACICQSQPSRTIPVCTGNTRQSPAFRAFVKDHPRMHGEHLWKATAEKISMGPSPYARGIHYRNADISVFLFLGLP